MCAWCLVSGVLTQAAAIDFEGIRPVLETYCYDCHGEGTAKGDVSLDKYPDHAALTADVKLWQTVWDALNNRVMPPRKKDQPGDAERAQLLAWIEREVFKIDCENPDPGRVTLRRLNRREYNLTVQDLFGINFSPAEDFPPDDSGYGFDNIADVLTLSPVLMDKYFNAAEQVVGKVVNFGPQEAPRRALQLEAVSDQEDPRRISEARFEMESEGDYAIVAEVSLASFNPFKGEVLLTVELDGAVLKQKSYVSNSSLTERVAFPQRLNKGAHLLRVIHDVTDSKSGNKGAGITFQTDRLLLEGPAGATEHPEPHRRIFFKGPAPADAAARATYAREILQSISGRAFRRPADDLTLDRLTALALKEAAQPGKSFEAGIAHALQAVLVSPRFLFRAETQPQPDDPRAVHPLDEFSLASRLSYFLRGSLPDAELSTLAKAGQLRANLRAQATRLLAGDGAGRFVEDFVGQWLQTRDVEGAPSNDKQFKTVNPLRKMMREETEMLFAHLLHEDRDVMEMITANYTFLNPPLARFYGIPGVEGPQWRKVALPPESPRGGVLTHASFLLVTSNPTRTSPVKRGLFVLENILGAPPPPPPPNVPALEEPEKGKTRDVSLRQQLETHRTKAECAGCHSRMDPIGLGLENFDLVGRWRAEDDGHPVDPRGELVTGEKFTGVQELRAILGERREQFYRCLTQKLLTYALGRGLEHYDACAVNEITRRLVAEGGRFSTLLFGVLESAPFQLRRGDGSRLPAPEPTSTQNQHDKPPQLKVNAK